MLDQDNQLVELLGNSIDHVSLNIEGDPRVWSGESSNKPALFVATLDSPALKSNLAGALVVDAEQTTLSLGEETFLELRLAPNWLNRRFRGQQRTEQSSIEVTEPITLRLDAKECSVALAHPADDGAMVFDLGRIKVAATLSSPQAEFRVAKTQNVIVRDLLAELRTRDLRGETALMVQEKIEQRDPGDSEPRISQLRSDTTVTGLYDAEDRLALRSARFGTRTHVDQVSMAFVDGLLQQQGRISALVGPTAALEFSGSVPGDIDF